MYKTQDLRSEPIFVRRLLRQSCNSCPRVVTKIHMLCIPVDSHPNRVLDRFKWELDILRDASKRPRSAT